MTLRSKLIRLAHTRPDLRPALLPLLKSAAAPGTYIEEGDEVKVLSRKGWAKATVVSARRKRTGAVDLVFTSSVGDLKFTAKSDLYADNARMIEYVGKASPDKALKEREESLGRQMEREEAKEDFADLGRKALEKFDPKPGDKVLIAYSNGPKILETVNGINWNTGKVGVVKQKARSKQEEDALALAFWQFNQMSGRNLRAPKERDTRWIPAQQIVRVDRLEKPEGV